MLLLNILILTFCFGVNFSSCNPVFPRNGGQRFATPPAYRTYRSANGPHASPQSTMVFHGYYARPVLRTRQGIPLPDGAMTAFAAGETVQTGSSYLPPNQEYIPDCRSTNCQVSEDQNPQRVAPISVNEKQEPSSELQPPENIPEEIEQQVPENQIPIDSEEDAPAAAEDEPVSSTTIKSVQRKNKKPSLPRRDEAVSPVDEEDDDENEYNPFSGGRRTVPIYNSFFPMMFGGGGFGGVSGSRKKGSQSDGSSSYPSGATAIANSFSTGKGGVATSHATAYGGPRS